MIKTVKKLLLFVLSLSFAASCAAAEGGEVLWWLVGSDYGSIEGTSLRDGTKMTAKDLGVTDARVRYQNDTGEVGYLTLYGLGTDGRVNVLEGAAGVRLPAEYFGSLSGLSGTSYSFVLELGNYSNGQWTHTSMESAAVSYDTLVANKHITKWHETTPSYGTPWKPTGYTVVPEPTSGIMLLVGGALLMLRRRRNGIS